MGGQRTWLSTQHIPIKVRMEDGEQSVELVDVMRVWTEHLAMMGNAAPRDGDYDEQHRQEVESEIADGQLQDLNEEHDGRQLMDIESDITEDEVRQAVSAMGDRKATGVDHIPVELLKRGGAGIITTLALLFNLFLHHEYTPRQWNRGEVVPILKGQQLDTTSPLSYRPITLLTHVSKVFTSILNSRLAAWCERNGVLHESQCGFRRDRSTVDHIFTLHTATQLRALRDGESSYLCFVDLEKAYDNVWRDGLWCRMRRVGIRGKVLRIVQQLYVDVQSRYVVNDRYVTPWVTMWKGVRQGCVLSPLLFNIYVDALLRQVEQVGDGITVRGADAATAFCLHVLGTADDSVLAGETMAALQAKVTTLIAGVGGGG